MNRTLASIHGLCVLAVALAGCAPVAASAPGGCHEPPAVTSTTQTVAILSTTGPATAAYEQDYATAVGGATDEGARLVVNGVGDPTAAPSLLANAILVGDGNNGLERRKDLTCKLTATNEAFVELSQAPDPGVHDVFSALLTLAGNLDGPHTGPVDVVLLTPLTSDNGTPNLADPVVLADPEIALNELASTGRIPDCAGWTFHGVGVDAATDPALREFWRQYALRCGGSLVAWTSHLSDFPGARDAVPQADTDVTVTPTQVVADLGGDVLFDFGKADLRSETDAALAQVLSLMASTTGAITVVGHTDSRGDAARNLALSVQRAQSVAGWLADHGIDPTRITPDGVGAAEPAVPDAKTEEQHQANRRVTVTIQR